MAVALVGFDVDQLERLCGMRDVSEAAKRAERNRALFQGANRLYLGFLDALQRVRFKVARMEVQMSDLVRLWEALLLPLVWRNSQTRTADYQDLLPACRLYWEAHPQGFPWPPTTPACPGVWAPLGSLAYFYFHYGIVHCPQQPLAYADWALYYYWKFLVDAYGEPTLGYHEKPKRRWTRVLELLGWRSQAYKQVEAVLLDWLQRGTDTEMQLALQQAFLTPTHIEDLERKLLLGSAHPSLLTFLVTYQARVAGELSRRLRRQVQLSFQFPVQQRWRLGPGGVYQVLLAFLVEALVLVGYRFASLPPDLAYGAFLGSPQWASARQEVSAYLRLAYDALTWLAGLYPDIDMFRTEVLVMLLETMRSTQGDES